jgi:hypothetical protein
MGVLVLAGFPLHAYDDIIVGPWLTKNPATNPLTPVKAPTDALGKYKHQIYIAVGSRWHASVDQALASLPPGKVRIRFTVHSDGNLEDLKVLEGDRVPFVDICISSIKSVAPFKRFDEALIKQVGQKYTDDFSFISYGPK